MVIRSEYYNNTNQGILFALNEFLNRKTYLFLSGLCYCFRFALLHFGYWNHVASVSHLFLFFFFLSYGNSWHIKYKHQLFCSYWSVNIVVLFKQCHSHFLVVVTKRFTRRDYLSLQLKGLPAITAGKHRERLECEVANHIVYAVRKKKANRWAQTMQPQSLPAMPHFVLNSHNFSKTIPQLGRQCSDTLCLGESF